ncbi:MAG TPA: HAD family hydrolase [Azospirillum sp.]|nr:HAD family hydrolase [Azospirillum sp.]
MDARFPQGFFENRQVLVFDWDGTLFDSMALKTQSFAEVLSEDLAKRCGPAAPSRERVAALYRALSGRPRAEIFDGVAATAGVTLGAADKAALSDRLFVRNRVLLPSSSLFPDAERLLERLQGTAYRLFMSSSVPQAELEHFFTAKLPEAWRQRFDGVFGSAPGFGKGPGHIEAIRRQTGVALANILVFGDDEADHALSTQAGVDCVLIDREGRPGSGHPYTIPSFDSVGPLLS